MSGHVEVCEVVRDTDSPVANRRYLVTINFFRPLRRTQVATHIGNAVPVGAGEAIGMRVLSTLAGNDAGAWSMESGSVWVRPEERTVQV